MANPQEKASGAGHARRRIDYHEHETPPQELFPEISHVASANECTGLMYRAPNSAAELENYRELSPMAIPRKGAGEGKNP